MPDSEQPLPDEFFVEPESEIDEPSLRVQLMAELETFIERLQGWMPGIVPWALTPQGMLESLGTRASRLRDLLNTDLIDPDTWRGAFYVVGNTLQYQGDILKRRLTGDYQTDPWGTDEELMEIFRPLLDFLYKVYWRVEMRGIEHVSADERALLITGQTDQSPWVGLMLTAALLNDHSDGRLLRSLFSPKLATLPFLPLVLTRLGHVVAGPDNCLRLLEQDEVVAVYPAAVSQKRPSGRVLDWEAALQVALQAQSPVLPTIIQGTEAAVTALGKVSPFTRLTGTPHPLLSPKSPAFPLLALFPPPTQWRITLSSPIDTRAYPPTAADDPALVAELVAQVKLVLFERR